MMQRYVHESRAFALVAGLALSVGACSDGSKSDLTGSGGLSASAAADIAAATSRSQTATVGMPVPATPGVAVTTANGAPLPGVSVTFAVTAGGGAVQNATAITNGQGIANAGRWTLGAVAGTQSVEARVGALAPVVFTAMATAVAPPFAITVRYIAAASARQQQAVAEAVARWQSVITADLANVPIDAPAGSCFDTQPRVNETIDDIVIFVEFVNIDGTGKILGQAGPCYVRSGNSLPVLGQLKLDIADLQKMEQNGTLDDVVLHEIGHVLGIGTLWGGKALLSGAGTADPRFTGSWALNAYRGLGGVDPWVAVENTGSEGTRDGHWRESTFGSELMTGYISIGGNPMSAITIASLSDLGYGTNPGAASAFTLSRTSRSLEMGVDLHKSEKRVRPKFRIDHLGRKTKIDL